MSDDNLDIDDGSEEEPEEAPKPAARKSMRPKRGAGAVAALPSAVGVAPGAPQSFRREAIEADAVWNELVAWLPSAGLTPRDIAIQVRRVAPPAPSGEPLPIGRAFGGEMVSGNNTEPPGSALVQFVMRYMHMPLTQTPASYDLMFMRKTNGAKLATGRLALPSAQDCQAMLQAGEQAGLGNPGAAPPQMYQAPPMYPQPQGAGQIPPGMSGYGYPYPPPSMPQPWGPPQPQGFAGPDQTVMNELAYLRGALGEALNAAREGRQPNLPGAPAPAPAGAGGMTDLDVDRIAARVATMMGASRAVAAPPPPPVQPAATVAAPPPPDNSVEGMMRGAVAGMTKRIFEAAIGSVEKSVTRGIGIGGLPNGANEDDDEEQPAPAQVIPPENPQDMVPWKVGDVGANWSNGSPVKIAMNKETGKLDPMGLAFANPAVAEKLIDVANGLGLALQDAIKNFGKPVGAGAPPQPQAQVVHQIPRGAVDATVVDSNEAQPAIPEGWQAP
jgi:hypothetical protein